MTNNLVKNLKTLELLPRAFLLLLLLFVALSPCILRAQEDLERVRMLAEKTLQENDLPLAIKYHKKLKELLQVPGQKSLVCLNLISLFIETGDYNAAKIELKNFEELFSSMINSDPITRAKIDYFKILLELKDNTITSTIEKLRSLVEPHPQTDKDFNCHVFMSLVLSFASVDEWPLAVKYARRIETENAGEKWLEAGKTLRIASLILSGDNNSDEYGKPEKGENALLSNILTLYAIGFQQEAITSYEKIDKKSFAKNAAALYALWALATVSTRNKDFTTASIFLKDAQTLTDSGLIAMKLTLLSGELSSSKGQFKKAISIYENFFLTHPAYEKTEDVRLKYATTLFEDGQKEKALHEYSNIIESSAPSFQLKAASDAAEWLIKLRDFTDAEKMISKISTINLPEAMGLNSILSSKLKFSKGDYAEAAKMYSKTAIAFPELKDDALLGEIKSYYQENNFKEILSFLKNKNIDISNSRHIQEILFIEASATKQIGNTNEALRLLNAYSEKYPNSIFTPKTIFEAAEIHLDKKEYIKASEKFITIATKYPDNELAQIAMYRKTYSDVMDDRANDAEKTVAMMVEKWPRTKYTGFALLWLGDFKRDTGQNTEAEKIYMQIKNLYAEHKDIAAEALLEASKIAIKNNDQNKGFSLFDELSEKFPDQSACSEAYFIRGDILCTKNEYEKAIPFFLKASMKRPDSNLALAAYGRLGDSYFSISSDKGNENLLKAADFYRKVTESSKASTETREQAMFKLGKCEEKLGDIGAALANYRELIHIFEIDWRRGDKRDTLWLVKTATATIKIYLEKADSNSISAANELYLKLLSMGVESIKQMKQNIDTANEKQKNKE